MKLALDLSATFEVARELSRNYTTTLGNRAYDILQVAAAVVAGAGEFLSFDEKQRKLAAAAGLTVGP